MIEDPKRKLLSLEEKLREFEKKLGFKSDIKWKTFASITGFHIFGIYLSCLYAFPVKWQTVIYSQMLFVLSGMGITCGVHRLWTHRSYKATLPLKIFLTLCFASAGQNSIYDWVRDHRLHHKYSDTDADPHNVNRGFLFSHIGWLMLKKNDLVLTKGRQIDMSDIESDKVLMWEKKYSTQLSLLLCFFLPTLVPIYFWNENLQCAITWVCFIRFLSLLHSEMMVNSLAHMFGMKPYNKNILPAQNRFVSLCTFGEGWHNYHHVFPYDFKTSETFYILDWSTFFIKCFAKMGLAYDLKEPSPEMVACVVKRLNNAEKVELKEY